MVKLSPDSIGMMSLFKGLFSYQRRYPLLLGLSLICVLMRVSYDLIFPLISERLFNSILNSNNFDLFFEAMLWLGISFLVYTLGNYFQAIVTPKLSFKLVTLIRYKLFGQMQATDLEDEPDLVGKFTMYFVNDIYNISSATIYYQWGTISNIVLATFGTVMLAYFDWRMTILSAIVIPLTLVLPRFFAKANQRQFAEKHQRDSELIDTIQEAIYLHDVIRLFSLKKMVRRKFRQELIPASQAGESYSRTSEFTYRSVNVGTSLVQYIVIFLGGYLVMIGELSPGKLIGFYLLLSKVNTAINSIMNIYPSLLNSAGSMNKIQNFLQQKNHPDKMPTSQTSEFTNNIRLENLYFHYGKEAILNNINLELRKGKFIAFVGASGSGKSTLMKILLKEIAPTEGHIYLDNVDYQDLLSTSLLKQFGVVMQQPKLFAGSILDNIRMGKIDATFEEIEEAAKKAGIHDDIMELPKKYKTLLGEGHVRLSGGQAQRLTIARAIIASPPILFCDEVTSALDPISGAGIEELLLSMARNHTIISITHRLSSVVNADYIVVLHHGEIVESGNHTSLLALKGMYTKLWEKQQGFIFNADTQQTMLIPSWLTQVPLFAHLDPEFLNGFSNEFVMERRNPNEIVFREGDRGEKFYILVAGIVEVYRVDSEGNETILAKLIDGDFFGEVALLYDMPRNANVRTKGVCIFLTLHYSKFQQLFKRLSENDQAKMLNIANERLSDEQREHLALK